MQLNPIQKCSSGERMRCSGNGSTKRSRGRVLAALFAAVAASRPYAARATDYSYTGPNNGLWSTGGNWTPAGVPFNPADNVNIHPSSASDFTVLYDSNVGNATINNLGLDPFGAGNAILSFTAFQGLSPSLTATQEIVGDFADGSAAGIIQHNDSGFANNVTTLILGNRAGGTGIYNLSAGTLNATNLFLGNQTGSSTGTLNLTWGTLNSTNEQIGSNGVGVFNQTAGSTHTVSSNLILGSYSGSRGSYLLDYFTAALSVNGTLDVGNGGTGTFTLANGTATVGSLVLGALGTGNGTYILGANNSGVSSPVQLKAGSEYIGSAGTGSFSQTAGTNTVTGDLYIGYQGTGTYNITFGTTLPHLSASNIYLGYSAGSHGTLNATDTYTEAVDAGSIYVGGSAMQAGGTGVLTVGGSSSVNVFNTLKVWNTPGSVINLSGFGSITAQTLDLSGNPALLNWTGGSLTLYSGLTIGPGGLLGASLTLGPTQHLTLHTAGNQGIVQLTAGGTLTGSTLTADEVDQLGGTFNGNLSNSGVFSYTSGAFNGRLTNSGTITLNADFTATDGMFNYSSIPFTIAQGRQVTLGGSGLTNNGTIELAGILSSSSLSMIRGGVFQQSAGSTHTVSGNFSLLGGSYSLNQSALSVNGNETIGSQADAYFSQSGGGSLHTIANDLQISGGGRGNASFSFSGGTLTVGGNTSIGVGGAGTFTQSGNPTFTGNVTVGDDSTGSGTYDVLSGTSTFQTLNIHKTGTLILESQPNPAILNGSSIFLAGSMTVTKSAQLNAPATFALGSTVTIGGGTLTLNAASTTAGQTISGAGSLAVTASASLSGWGVLNLASVQNAGTLTAKSGDLLIPSGTSLTNSGTLQNNVGANLFIESAVVNHTGNIIVNGSGSVVFDQPITDNAGKSITLLGGTLATPTLTNASGGNITGFGQITGNLINQGSVSFYAPTQIVGNLTNAASGTFAVTNVQTVVTGAGLNQGTIHVTKGAVIFQGGLTNNGTYISDPSTNYFTDWTIGTTGSVSGGAGDNFYVSGNFTNTSTQTGTWNTSASLLGFQGGVSHQATVAGTVGQFGWGTIQINAGDSVTVNGNSLTAASTVNNGSLFHVSGTSSLGTLSGTGSLSVGNSSGGAAAALTVASLNQSSVIVNATGALTIAHSATPAVSNVNSLTIQTGGQLDLSNSTLFINYGAGPDPLSTILGYVASGYNNGAWNGPGIISSTAAANPTHTTEIGIADSAHNVVGGLAPNTIELKYTLLGDANLDGVVNSADLQELLFSFNSSGRSWDQADFNYDGTVNSTDLQNLLFTFNTSLGPTTIAAAGSVPEPATMVVMLLGGASLLRRRRGVAQATPGEGRPG
jgi:hypothetical protein